MGFWAQCRTLLELGDKRYPEVCFEEQLIPNLVRRKNTSLSFSAFSESAVRTYWGDTDRKNAGVSSLEFSINSSSKYFTETDSGDYHITTANRTHSVFVNSPSIPRFASCNMQLKPWQSDICQPCHPALWRPTQVTQTLQVRSFFPTHSPQFLLKCLLTIPMQLNCCVQCYISAFQILADHL